mmetsp:Transcript_24312/g.51343  ORF Transcript_24312/g.51343 Transcript_24312/m.51343 type:complete len:89 (+) Transcript_24312:181-447(+)
MCCILYIIYCDAMSRQSSKQAISEMQSVIFIHQRTSPEMVRRIPAFQPPIMTLPICAMHFVTNFTSCRSKQLPSKYSLENDERRVHHH